MKLKQISVFIENRPGALIRPCRILADAGINLTTLTLADTRDFGMLRLMTPDWEKGAAVLKENGFAVVLSDVLAIQVPDRPGGLAELLEKLTECGLNVEYMYATIRVCGGQPVMVFRFEDAEEAVQKLKTVPEICIVGPDRFYTK